MLFRISLLAITLTFSGCTSLSQLPPVSRNVVNKIEPPLNKIQTQELGNTLIQFYIATTMPSIEVTQKWSTWRGVFDLPPQILVPLGKGETISKYSVSSLS